MGAVPGEGAHAVSLGGLSEAESLQEHVYLLRGSMPVNFSARLNQALHILEKRPGDQSELDILWIRHADETSLYHYLETDLTPPSKESYKKLLQSPFEIAIVQQNHK